MPESSSRKFSGLSFDIQRIACLRRVKNFVSLHFLNMKMNISSSCLRNYDFFTYGWIWKVGKFTESFCGFGDDFVNLKDRLLWDCQTCLELANFRTSCHFISLVLLVFLPLLVSFVKTKWFCFKLKGIKRSVQVCISFLYWATGVYYGAI